MVSKRKNKTTFSEIMMMLTLGGAMLIGSLLRIFVFGIGLILVFVGFSTPDNTIGQNSIFIILGLVLMALGMFSKYIFNRLLTGVSENPSDTQKRIVTGVFVGVSIATFSVFLTGAMYWTSVAVNASIVKNANMQVVATATQQDWEYPFMIVPRAGSIGSGKSSSTDKQVLADYVIGDTQYTTTTIAHIPQSSTGTVELYYDPADPSNAVSWSLWSASLMQAVVFDVMALVFALGSAFLTVSVIKDGNFLYTTKTHSSRRTKAVKSKK